MDRKKIQLKALVNLLLYLIVGVLVVIFLPKLIMFFMPFLIGWIIASIANPVVRFFEEKIKFKRKAMSAIMIVLLIAIIIFAAYGLIVLLVSQSIGLVQSIQENWDTWKETVYEWTDEINRNMPENVREIVWTSASYIEDYLTDFVKNMGQNATQNSDIITTIFEGIGSIGAVIVGIIMCVLSAYFFTVEHNSITAGVEKHIPRAIYVKAAAAYKGLSKAVSGYFKAQFKIEVWVYFITLIGLLIIRADYSIIMAFLIAFLDLLPFFGAGLIMIPWAAFTLFSENYFFGIGLLITWGVGQLVRQLIQPKIVGDSVGLAPIPTLLSLFIGFKLMGVFGMVIAVPIAMILIALYEEGVFATFVDSVKIIWSGINNFRKLPERPWKE